MRLKTTLLATISVLLTITLSACGGGGGGTTTTTLTPATQAPVASGVSNSTELASSVSISRYRSVSIAATTTSSVQTASLFDKFKSILANAFIKPAIAQTSTSCQTDAYKLVGIGDDGSLTPLSITQGSDSCNVGFREMFDIGSYAILTGEGIYKNGLTCNLVFLHKSTGNLFCVGESLPSRYQITASSSSASSSSSVAEKIQTVLDSNNTTSFVLLNAQSTTFDSNNQISGLKTKLLRFDLRDLENGPKAAVIVEGYQSGWSQYTTATEFEYFNLENYRLAKNGDALVVYYKSIWTPGSMSASGSSYRRNLKYFYNFADSGDTFEAATLKDTEALTLINNALTAQATSTSSSQTPTNWGWLNISCMFDAPANDGGILITTPSNSWVSGYNNGNYYQQWSSSSSIFRVSRPSSSSAGKPVFAFVKPSLLCADTSGWSGNLPQKVGDTWFTIQSASYYGWTDSSQTNYQWGTRTSVVGNTLSASTNNVNDDIVFTVPVATGGSTPAYYWGMNNTKIRASKDYLYLLKQSSTYMPGSSTSQDGIEVSRFRPSAQTSGAIITGIDTIISPSRSLSISAFTTNQKDNTVDLVGRDIASDDLDKVYGTISDEGTYTQKPITTTKYSTVAIVKL